MIIKGDCIEEMKKLPENSVDAVVTDPHYELGFMGKKWDNTGIAYNKDMWAECLRVLKPGGHLLAFSGTRTYHRMAVAIEDAGFEIRDMVEWVYGSGFPKSLNIGKAVDKIQGNSFKKESFRPTTQQGPVRYGKCEVCGKSKFSGNPCVCPKPKSNNEWEGWGTALKPAHEPICLARKPIEGTVANNVLKYGTGGLNIDKSRVGTEKVIFNKPSEHSWAHCHERDNELTYEKEERTGRFPANLLHDGSDEVVREFPNESERFFKSFLYCPKASKSERERGCGVLDDKLLAFSNQAKAELKRGNTEFKGNEDGVKGKNGVMTVKNNHPTVKPLALMKYPIQMITPPGGTVLDPFAGSGSTLVAAKELGYDFIGIEMTEEYIPIIEARLAAVKNVQETLL